ncbi:MAG TPA: HAMP domain-containing sensor histidine kinase [Candidatus Saccharimonadia bacterium]|jgi:signal transduction histidine kinase
MTLKLNRQQRELIYSTALIILIPACMIGSTLWLTSQVKQDFDQELRRKANLANEVFNVSVQNALTTGTAAHAAPVIQGLINQTVTQAPDIDLLGVSVPSGSGFTVLADSDPTRTGQADTTIQTQVAKSEAQPVASLIAMGEAGSREWLVATPVTTETGRLLAVTTIRVSLHSADGAMNTTLRNALIMLSVMISVIVLLLLHHFRFVEYAELFRKQKELDQLKDDFISIATHELKAPITLIKGYISMVLEMKLTKDARDQLQIAFDQTDRLGRLVTDLLDVSRIEQGRTKYNITTVNLPATINPMMANFEIKANDKNLHLSYKPPADLPPVAADPDRVMEVFTNLIDNAIKYSRTGTVTVSHASAPTTVTTTVSDTGIGMTPDEQSRLFQRFYRARNDDTKDIAGTGLGLWIIKQYIEHMGGSIQVQSQKGKGTSFIVTLNRANPAPPPPDGLSPVHDPA